ncbi:MAG: ExbD/TolR family protein [Planctomycetota bacterium]|jgi:biopolymer transport protein ExbD
MFFKDIEKLHQHPNSGSFNLTPVIDIVFLLILFFLVVCQFIEAENFPVNVPDICKFAENNSEQKFRVTTLSVVKTSDNNSIFAVDAEKIEFSDYDILVSELVNLLNKKLENLPLDQRIVTLRIDKDICFNKAQYALAGIAESIATDIKISALKEKLTATN